MMEAIVFCCDHFKTVEEIRIIWLCVHIPEQKRLDKVATGLSFEFLGILNPPIVLN